MRRMVPLIARRRASVGWAVSTGRNSSSPSLRSASSRPTSSVSRANAAGMVSSRTAGPVVVSASRERSTRTRWYSSARFARWK